jgi:hypothetical protein
MWTLFNLIFIYYSWLSTKNRLNCRDRKHLKIFIKYIQIFIWLSERDRSPNFLTDPSSISSVSGSELDCIVLCSRMMNDSLKVSERKCICKEELSKSTNKIKTVSLPKFELSTFRIRVRRECALETNVTQIKAHYQFRSIHPLVRT